MNEIFLTQELVKIDSVTGRPGEKQALLLLKTILEDAGFACSEDYYGSSGAFNLTARLNPGCGDDALMFCGHIDTVPVVEESWTYPPFSAEIVDGRIYGRGSSDMKSGIAAMVAAAVEAAPALKGKELILQIYSQEEIGCVGSFHAALQLPGWCRASGIVVPEPTKNRPKAGHRGTFWVEASTTGISAHASTPELGTSALAKLLPLASFLADYQPEHALHPFLGRCSSVLSTFQAGVNINSVPDYAKLTIDLRPVPGQNTQEILDDIKQASDQDVDLKVLSEIPALWTDPAEPWFRSVRSVCDEYLDAPSGIEAVPFATDGAFVGEKLPETPIVILGPGDPDQAHKLNEYCDLKDICVAKEIYLRMIDNFW